MGLYFLIFVYYVIILLVLLSPYISFRRLSLEVVFWLYCTKRPPSVFCISSLPQQVYFRISFFLLRSGLALLSPMALPGACSPRASPCRAFASVAGPLGVQAPECFWITPIYGSDIHSLLHSRVRFVLLALGLQLLLAAAFGVIVALSGLPLVPFLSSALSFVLRSDLSCPADALLWGARFAPVPNCKVFLHLLRFRHPFFRRAFLVTCLVLFVPLPASSYLFSISESLFCCLFFIF